MENENLSHSLHLVNGQLNVAGVKDVERFSPEEVGIVLNNDFLTVKGQDIQVKEINTEHGTLKVIGKILSLTYGGTAAKGFVKRLFK